MNNQNQPVVPEISPSTMTNIEAYANVASALHENSRQGKGPVTQVALEVNQVPTEANGNRAVVTSTVTTAAGSFQGIGTAAELEAGGQIDVQRTIDGAAMQAMVRAFGTASLVEVQKAFLVSEGVGQCIVVGEDGSFGSIDAGQADSVQ